MRIKTTYGPGKPTIWHAAEVPDDQRLRSHGRGTYEVSGDVTAGNFTSIRFTFEIGEQEIPVDGRLTIIWRWPFDWSAPQADDSQEAGFYRIETRSVIEASFNTTYQPYGGIEPYHHYLDLRLASGSLTQGDCVTITVGDQSDGSPGWRAPSCSVKEAYFLMCIDPEGNDQWTELVRQRPFTIHPGPPQRSVTIAPTDVVVGQPFQIIVRVEDEWGNATHADQPPRLLSFEETQTSTIDHPPAYHYMVQLDKEGTHRIASEIASSGITSESNPIRVHKTKPATSIFWGDLHSGQTLIGCGAGTLAEHYAFGRDAAGLTFITHQANDHYVTVADWQETRKVTKQFYEPGKYIAILGCEWSPMTPAGGDRNVFYKNDEPRLRQSDRFFEEAEPDPEPDIPTAPEFHNAFRDEDVLVNIHVGGRMTNLDWWEPKIEKLAECHSTHGTVQWFVEDCLKRGYPIAVTAGTDGVMGRPGACHPGSRLIRNVRNGLTAVVAEDLTLDSLWDAFHQRRTYGTTGARIILSVDVNGHPMGDEFETSDPPRIRVNVEGTAPIEYVELLRGTDVIHRWDIADRHEPSDRKLRVMWSGTQERGTARRQRAVWDGTLEVDGEILDASSLGFQSPLDALRHEGRRLSWKSITAGNDAGVIVTLNNEWTKAKFTSDPATFEFAPDDLVASAKLVAAGGYDRRVSVSWAPKDNGPTHADLEFEDVSPATGWCPYWVKVVQVDRERAWSTPVYVTRK